MHENDDENIINVQFDTKNKDCPTVGMGQFLLERLQACSPNVVLSKPPQKIVIINHSTANLVPRPFVGEFFFINGTGMKISTARRHDYMPEDMITCQKT